MIPPPRNMMRRSITVINGLGQQKNLDPVAICGGVDKVKRVETQITFLNGLLSSLTFGIYTPFQARVYCSE